MKTRRDQRSQTRIFAYSHILILLSLFITIIAIYTIAFSSRAEEVRVIELTAKQFAFQLKDGTSIIKIEKGEKVIFRVKSLDVTHGFYIDGLNINEEIPPGEIVNIGPIVFTTVGKYKIRCGIACGPLHPFMTADIVVEEHGINYVLYGMFALTLIIGIVSMLYIYRKGATIKNEK